MAKFEIAEAITGRNEGGYANNPSDKGGETYAGIARNYWPRWVGWVAIDEIKRTKGKTASIINKNAKENKGLQIAVSSFYKQNFWDAMNLDLVNDQQLANSVYDFGVNSGTARAAKFLQQSINSVYSTTLTIDGQIGQKTLKVINDLGCNEPETIYNEFNRRREDFYRLIAKGSQAQFLKSWLSRLKPYQK